MENNISIESIEIPGSFLFLSERNVGKTVLCEYIIDRLLEAKKIDVAYIYSNTCMLGNNWRSIPDRYKSETIEYKKINKIIDKQAKEVKKYTASKAKKKKEPKQVALIFDDIIDSSSNKHNLIDLLNMLYSKGRHFKISVFLCNQYVKQLVTPTLRSNIDHLFISNNTIEVLYFVYSIVIFDGNKKKFVEFIQNNSQDFYFVMYDNISRDNSNRFFRIKADPKYIESRIGKNKY